MKMQSILNSCRKKFGLLLVYLSVINCSSPLSLLRERLRPVDSIPDRGVLELSLNNEGNKKVGIIYIHGLLIYDQDLIKKTNIFPLFLQGHEGELYANSPYEINILPGEYFIELRSIIAPFRKNDLQFPFQAYFGYYYQPDKYTEKLIISENEDSFCSTISQSNVYKSEKRCQKIILKKDKKTKIIIHAQPNAPIKSDIGLQGYVSGNYPIILPQEIKTRETPEVLIEVQNPK